jgi:hypothetical protein
LPLLPPEPEQRKIVTPEVPDLIATRTAPDSPTESIAAEDGGALSGPVASFSSVAPTLQVNSLSLPTPPNAPAPAVGQANPPASLPATLPADIATVVSARSDGPVELRLSPEELGRLHLHLHSDGDVLRVTVLAERPETLDLLRRHADLLIHEIRAAGFAGGSFTFAGWGGGSAGGRAEAPANPAARADLPEGGFHDPATSGSVPMIPSVTGLDLRL